MKHLLKHHWTRHKHHFGLWALSGLILLASTWWLGRLSHQATARDETTAILSSGFSQSTSTSPTIPLVKVKKTQKARTGEAPLPLSNPSLPNPVASSSAPAVVPDQSLIEVTFEFVFSPGVTSTFVARAPEGASVYEAMRALAAIAPVQFEFKEYAGLGAMLTAINGVANDARASKFWIYYRNGAAAPVGISSLRVAPGDVITWRYE